jgi:hypothetical protein
LDNFPSVLAVIKENAPYLHYNQGWVDFAQYIIKKHKPKRVLFAHRWFGYWKYCYQCTSGMKSFTDEHFEMVKSHSQQYSKLMGELVQAGIEVSVVTIHLDDDRIDPRHYYDANGVIEKNLAPLKLSEFR